MRSALATLPAAYQVGHDLARDEVYVAYDARAGDAKTAAKAMIVAIQAAGFDPSAVPGLKGTAVSVLIAQSDQNHSRRLVDAEFIIERGANQ